MATALANMAFSACALRARQQCLPHGVPHSGGVAREVGLNMLRDHSPAQHGAFQHIQAAQHPGEGLDRGQRAELGKACSADAKALKVVPQQAAFMESR